MTTVAKRSGSSLSELMDWLEAGPGAMLRELGRSPVVRVEDYTEDGTYVMRAEMPGIDPEKDIEITVDQGRLTLSGERREELKDKFHQEFSYGSFSRSIALPAGVDATAVTATYTDGVLEVRVPMGAPATEATKVPIQRPEGA